MRLVLYEVDHVISITGMVCVSTVPAPRIVEAATGLVYSLRSGARGSGLEVPRCCKVVFPLLTDFGGEYLGVLRVSLEGSRQ